MVITRQTGGLLVWGLACLFPLPLEFVKTPSMEQSSTYRVNTIMAGVDGMGGGDGVRPNQQKSIQ